VNDPTREERLSDRVDAGEDEIDAGKKLLAVVVHGQLFGYLSHEGVFRRVKLRPLRGDGAEKRCPIGVSRK
jgi:hypothetical protein